MMVNYPRSITHYYGCNLITITIMVKGSFSAKHPIFALVFNHYGNGNHHNSGENSGYAEGSYHYGAPAAGNNHYGKAKNGESKFIHDVKNTTIMVRCTMMVVLHIFRLFNSIIYQIPVKRQIQ